MASNRHLSRIIAIQSLYEWEFISKRFPMDEVPDQKSKIEEILERNYNEFKKAVNNRDFINELVWGVLENEAKVDSIIKPAAPEWPIEQIALLDLVILRMSIFELLFKREVPPKVAINEAVELAKTFGGLNSSRFVNGVLGTVYRASEIYNPEDDKKPERKENKDQAPESKA